MVRGLLWLPLLAVFIGLAWAGWNEFQKLEAYRLWAQQFEHAKYDIYAVLGQQGSDLTWGKPTRSEPINVQTFSLQQVQAICLRINEQVVDLVELRNVSENSDMAKGQIFLEFRLLNSDAMIRIPFTDRSIAIRWGKHLQQDLQQLQSK